MRRKDREITDFNRIVEIIETENCCRLGLYDGEEVYVVPMGYGYEVIDNNIIFYFHGAKQGRKTDIIESNPYIAFEIDRLIGNEINEVTCQSKTTYYSVIGNGIAKVIDSEDEKKHALNHIMNHFEPNKSWQWSDVMLNNVLIFKLEVTKLSAKESN